MIYGHCVVKSSMLGDAGQLPTVFSSIPQKGELVRSDNGKLFEVLAVIHYEQRNTPTRNNPDKTPKIEVMLKPNSSYA